MARVELKGLHHATARLANGRRVTYWYAWRGGQRLPGNPGTPEFMAAYNEAVASKGPRPFGSLQAILNAYQESSNFTNLAPRTKADYARQIRKLEAEFGDLPIAALADRRVRGDFKDWRDRLAKESRRQADYAFTVLALVLAWAYDGAKVPANPCERIGRLYNGTRVENVWSQEDETKFLKAAPAHLALAFTLALWTGQRQGDLLRMTWTQYDGATIWLRQGKTKARVAIPVGAPLKALLDRSKRTAVTILTTEAGVVWTADGFRSSWRKACARAQIVGLTFNDLRGTAVTRLALAGCTEAEIATITGHSLRDVSAILDAHYLRRDAALAVSAIEKRERHEAGTHSTK